MQQYSETEKLHTKIEAQKNLIDKQEHNMELSLLENKWRKEQVATLIHYDYLRHLAAHQATIQPFHPSQDRHDRHCLAGPHDHPRLGMIILTQQQTLPIM